MIKIYYDNAHKKLNSRFCTVFVELISNETVKLLCGTTWFVVINYYQFRGFIPNRITVPFILYLSHETGNHNYVSVT